MSIQHWSSLAGDTWGVYRSMCVCVSLKDSPPPGQPPHHLPLGFAACRLPQSRLGAGNLLCSFRSSFVAMEATFWFAECKGNPLLLVPKICPKDRLLLFFWKSLIGRFPPSAQSEVLYLILSPTSKLKLSQGLWKGVWGFHRFPTNGWSWRWCSLQWDASQSECRRLSRGKQLEERGGERSPGKRRSLPLHLSDRNTSVFCCKALWSCPRWKSLAGSVFHAWTLRFGSFQMLGYWKV